MPALVHRLSAPTRGSIRHCAKLGSAAASQALPATTARAHLRSVCRRLSSFHQRMECCCTRFHSAARPRFQFKVATLEQADTGDGSLLRGRGRALACSGVILSLLQRVGHRVQFRRARLFINGQLSSAPLQPSPA